MLTCNFTLVFRCRCMCVITVSSVFIFFFKQKTAYEMRISDWSSDVCSSDLHRRYRGGMRQGVAARRRDLRACADLGAGIAFQNARQLTSGAAIHRSACKELVDGES